MTSSAIAELGAGRGDAYEMSDHRRIVTSNLQHESGDLGMTEGMKVN